MFFVGFDPTTHFELVIFHIFTLHIFSHLIFYWESYILKGLQSNKFSSELIQEEGTKDRKKQSLFLFSLPLSFSLMF